MGHLRRSLTADEQEFAGASSMQEVYANDPVLKKLSKDRAKVREQMKDRRRLIRLRLDRRARLERELKSIRLQITKVRVQLRADKAWLGARERAGETHRRRCDARRKQLAVRLADKVAENVAREAGIPMPRSSLPRGGTLGQEVDAVIRKFNTTPPRPFTVRDVFNELDPSMGFALASVSRRIQLLKSRGWVESIGVLPEAGNPDLLQPAPTFPK